MAPTPLVPMLWGTRSYQDLMTAMQQLMVELRTVPQQLNW